MVDEPSGEALALESIRTGTAARQGLLFPAPEGNGSGEAQHAQEEARIRELELMGLPAWQLRLCRAIGYDNFLTMWRIVDVEAQGGGLRLTENESMVEVQMRRFASFRRYQRNRFIETLARCGLTGHDIRATVKAQLGEELSESHISRMVRRARMNR